MAGTGISSIVSNQVAGFDAKAAVKGLLSLDQTEIDLLKKKQSDIVAKQDLLNTLKSDLQALRTTAVAMADSATFLSYTASLSSNNASVPASNLLSVSGTNAVSAGNHAITVDQIATAKRISSSSAVLNSAGVAITSDTIALGYTGTTTPAGTIVKPSFTINGQTVTIDSADSLQDIAAKINQLNTGASATGVTASVIKTNTNDYRLVLAADNTGSTGFSISGSALNSGGALANLQIGSLQSSAAVTKAGTAISDATTALNVSGTFQVQAGSTGTATNITVNANDSLQSIANKISAVAGLTATVDTISTNDLRLSIGIDNASPPADNTISIIDSTGALASTLANLGLSATSTSNTQSVVEAPADAKMTIDGLQVTRSSNSISDVLSGVTFDLKQADATTTVNMSVGVDTAALQSNVQSFVDGYNKVMSFINQQFTFDTKTNTNGPLASDPLLRSIQTQLSSSLLTAVPGLASDRNTLASIGIEPDAQGVLHINHALFDNFLNNSPSTIRDLFVATGTSNNTQLQFLTKGLSTPSGSYDVYVSSVAQQESRTGSVNLTTGLGTGVSDSLTVTDNGGHSATLFFNGSGAQGTGDGLSAANAADGSSITSIVSALNTEFAREITETRLLSQPLMTSTSPANSSTTFRALGVNNATTITISGTSRTGAAISGTYSVLDPTKDTVAGLLNAIQTAYNQKVIASIDSTGRIKITDTTGGDSQLRISLTSNNGAISFGNDAAGATEGRYPLSVTASNDGSGHLKIAANNYGPASGLSVVNSSGLLMGTVTSVAGADIAGTINGTVATGTGQSLMGTSGNIDGFSVFYTGATSGAVVGTITLGVGVGSAFDGLLDTYANSFTGLIASDISSMQSKYDSITSQINGLQQRMNTKRTTLTKSFTQMQQLLASLKTTGNFLSAQTNAQNATRP